MRPFTEFLLNDTVQLFMWFVTVGIAVSPFLMKFGVFTATVLTLFAVATLSILAGRIIPAEIIDKYPAFQYAILLIFPIGLALEYFDVFTIKALTTIPLYTLPPYTTTTEALAMYPELIFATILIAIGVVRIATWKKRE